MSDKVLARKGYVSADFLSGTYRISGDVNLRGMTLVLAIVILIDAFEAIILPRRVTRKIRVTRLFYRTTWSFWKASSVKSLLAKPGRRCSVAMDPVRCYY